MTIAIREIPAKYSGNMRCQKCRRSAKAWRTSGMSQCFPHFYCSNCSNVIHRIEDQKLVWDEKMRVHVRQIAATLPDCPCGGRFQPGANPKCPYCRAEYANDADTRDRLWDPFMIVMDEACVFSDEHEPYRLRIVEATE